MDYSELKSIINNIKASHSCYDFLKFTCGLPIPHEGTAISAPHFIRPDDHHPSFAVYHHICIDFASQQSYDIISLVMLALGYSFPDALEYLAGRKLFSHNSAPQIDSDRQHALDDLTRKIQFWHSELLKNQPVLDYLHSRRISDDTINSFMIGYSENMHKIIFPYTRRNSQGNYFVYYCGRDDSPITRKDLTPRYDLPRDHKDYAPKYQKAKLSASIIYENTAFGNQSLRPHSSSKHTYTGSDGQQYDTMQKDPRDTTLCILEGIVDALSFLQEGWQVQCPGGGHFSQTYKQELLDLCRNYERVFICFDNDKAGDNFRRTMCRILFDEHIPFICGHVPASIKTQDGRLLRVKDVSDYYTAGGDLAELVKNAQNGLLDMARASNSPEELEEIFSGAARYLTTAQLYDFKEKCMDITEDTPDEITGIFKLKYPPKFINLLFSQALKPIPEFAVAEMVAKNHTIRYDTAGKFYEYTRGIWREVHEYIVHKYVGQVLKAKASSRRMAAVTNYIRDMNADAIQFNTKNVICFPNGTLHLDEPDASKAFTAHSEDDMCTLIMSYSYDPDALCPKWRKFIHEVCDGDKRKMKLMQQMAGYIMFPNNKLQKFFYLVGDGRNGKSVYANILEQVYGPDNCSSIPPSRMGSQFDPIALKDSMLNICYEAKSVLNGSEEVIKAVASGDPITAAHKGVDAVSFKTRAKLMVLANRVWATNDTSYGLIRRIIFFKFDKQFMGSADNKDLYGELVKELPGIFNWCYEGYRDLQLTGEFEELENQAQILEELMESMSPVSAFVREVLCDSKFVRDCYGKTITERDVYAVYKEWCNDGNFKPLNRMEFMKDIGLLLRQRDYGVKIRSVRDDKVKEFVFKYVPEDETVEQEDTEGRDGRSVALGGVQSSAFDESEETACEEAETDAGEAEAVSTGTHYAASMDNGRTRRSESLDDSTGNIPGTQTAGSEAQCGKCLNANVSGLPVHKNDLPENETACHKEERLLSNNGDSTGANKPGAGCEMEPPLKAPAFPVRRIMTYPQDLAGTDTAKKIDRINYLLSLYAYRAEAVRREEMKNFTREEWEFMKDGVALIYERADLKKLKACGFIDGIYRHFKLDYMYYMQRLNWIAVQSQGFPVSDMLTDHGANLYGRDDEDMYRLALQYMTGGYKPETQDDWDELAVFFRAHREIEPEYFRRQYDQHH